jgi:hypothetical protein
VQRDVDDNYFVNINICARARARRPVGIDHERNGTMAKKAALSCADDTGDDIRGANVTVTVGSNGRSIWRLRSTLIARTGHRVRVHQF